MQQVSAAWRRLHRENVFSAGSDGRTISRVEITVAITDPSATSDYNIQSQSQSSFSNIDEIYGRSPISHGRYSTGEHGSWILDGNTTPFVHYNGNYGFVSESLSDENARFEQPIVISIFFDRVLLQSTPGMTIRWSEAFSQMAREIRLTSFLDGIVSKRENVILQPEPTSVINFEIESFNRIDIEILEWCLPHCRARIEHIGVGFFKLFTNTDIIDIAHKNSADPLGSIIPMNTLEFTIDNVDMKWNPTNPQGMFRFLIERQEVNLRYGYELDGIVEWIPGGVFYMSSWNSPQNSITSTFKASNSFSLMNEEYTGSLSGTLYEISERALMQANLPQLFDYRTRWVISDRLKEYVIISEQVRTDSIASVLQLCAHAASCGMWQDRHGTIHIAPITLGMEFELESDYGAPISDLSAIHYFSNFDKVATGELGIWSLDGTFGAVDEYTKFPFVSNDLSNESAIFEVPPRISILTAGNQRYTPNVQIMWSETYGEMARRFNVIIFHNGLVVDTIEVEDNIDIENIIFTNVEIFDTIVVEIIEWSLPYHRARIERLSIGPDYIIDRTNTQPEANVRTSPELRSVDINRGLAIVDNSNIGKILPVSNPLVETEEHAVMVGEQIRFWLSHRNIFYGKFAADPRLDPLDTVLVINQFAALMALVTRIDYRWFGGRFWGDYESRVLR